MPSPSKTCPNCGSQKTLYAVVCTNCKDWQKQPGGEPGNRIKRAAQVEALLANGLSKTEIARELGISRPYVQILILDPDGSKQKEKRRVRKPPTGKAKESSIARRKRFYARHRERLIATAVAYNRTSPRYRAYGAKYREEHREKAAEATKAWRKANPDKVQISQDVRRARVANAPQVERVIRQDIYARDGWRCHLCGKHVKKKEASLDHLVPLSKGGSHVPSNVALAHLRCNVRRGAGYAHAQLRLVG